MKIAPPKKAGNGKRTFTIKAPEAASVMLLGDFTRWQQSPIAMRQGAAGLWQAEVDLAPGTHQYRYLVDGQWQDDPQCRQRVANGFGGQNCVCQIE